MPMSPTQKGLLGGCGCLIIAAIITAIMLALLAAASGSAYYFWYRKPAHYTGPFHKDPTEYRKEIDKRVDDAREDDDQPDNPDDFKFRRPNQDRVEPVPSATPTPAPAPTP